MSDCNHVKRRLAAGADRGKLWPWAVKWCGSEEAARAVFGEKPNLVARAKSFVTAVVRHVAAGRPVVSDDEKRRRLTICNACPEFSPLTASCNLCGCRLNTKAAWALESCPIGKW